MSKTTGFATERTKPFPVSELDFSGNEITGVGIGAVVQFARTQGSDATLVDLSKNKLDDKAATEEVTRLVKNYSSFAANAFISTLLLSGNNIGRAGESRPQDASVPSALALISRAPPAWPPSRGRGGASTLRALCSRVTMPYLDDAIAACARLCRRHEAHSVRALGARPLQERQGATATTQAGS